MKTRREALKIAAGTAAVMPLSGFHAEQPAAAQAPAPKFFTVQEFRLVDELTEMIIPADEHSPGARGAKVVQYIDQRLAESFDTEPQKLWRDGLRRIEELSQLRHGKRFLNAPESQRVAVLTEMVSDDDEPKTLDGRFFQELKKRTVHAYYTSDIGIHREMEYQGNTYLDEFVGYDPK
jgi:hypothetical protein